MRKGSWHKRHKKTLLFPINKVVDMKKIVLLEKKFSLMKTCWKKAWRKQWWKSLHHHDEIIKENTLNGIGKKEWNNVNTKDEEEHAMVLWTCHTRKGKLEFPLLQEASYAYLL
jgi:hypothetical protein